MAPAQLSRIAHILRIAKLCNSNSADTLWLSRFCAANAVDDEEDGTVRSLVWGDVY